MLNNTEKIEKNQDEFEFLEKPSEKKAKMKDFLEKIKNKVSKKMSLKIFECGDIVGFLKSKGEKIRLHGGNFCNNRFCPLCSWRKAKKDGYLLMLLFSVVQKIHKKELIFLTLTAPNVVSELLESEIKDFNKSFERLVKTKDFKNICKGYIRKLEVTYNAKEDTYHPHFHVVIAVNKNYFTKNYINQKKWLEMWQVAKRNPKITQVDIRKAKLDDMKGVYEMATYSAKASDYLFSEDTFDTFYNALKGKQLITFNGLFKEILKEIKEGKHSELLESDGEIYNKQLWFNWIKEKYELFRTDELSDSEMQKIYVDEIEID
ncbi:MAG: protein rep [Cetobacterium sp.]